MNDTKLIADRSCLMLLALVICSVAAVGAEQKIPGIMLPELTKVTHTNVVQVDVCALLDARPVTTFTAGKLVTWNTFVDGYGKGSAYLTMAAARAVGDKNPKALPDNPLIPANGKRPEMLLHYSNDDAEKSQARKVVNDEPLLIPVPAQKYRQMFLAWTSGDGGSELKVDLIYADGTSATRTVRVPDYYNEVSANDRTWTYVVRDLNKWNPANKLTEGDGGHHSIHACDIAPDSNHELTSIKITKNPSRSHLLFWAATGVTTEERKQP
ncbi:MAG: hypothetical protein WCO56_20005 [Verrucomicrobiota bacterium]